MKTYTKEEAFGLTRSEQEKILTTRKITFFKKDRESDLVAKILKTNPKVESEVKKTKMKSEVKKVEKFIPGRYTGRKVKEVDVTKDKIISLNTVSKDGYIVKIIYEVEV